MVQKSVQVKPSSVAPAVGRTRANARTSIAVRGNRRSLLDCMIVPLLHVVKRAVFDEGIVLIEDLELERMAGVGEGLVVARSKLDPIDHAVEVADQLAQTAG